MYHQWQPYDVWVLRCEVWRTEFFAILDHFLPFNPLTTRKIKSLKNCKKTPGDIIILRKCTKTHEHILYCSLDMAHNRFNYFSFWGIFYHFTPLRAPKIKIKKNEKMPGDVIILHMCTKNYYQMMYSFWNIVHDRQMDEQKKWHTEVGAPPKNPKHPFVDIGAHSWSSWKFSIFQTKNLVSWKQSFV